MQCQGPFAAESTPLHDASSGRMSLPVPAIAILALTLVISLLVSHYRMMWFDEYLGLNTDSVHSLRLQLHIQRTIPLALDTISYHLLAHFSMRIFGVGAFAIRLPSLLGYLLMQVCLYFFVRRIASQSAALFAMIFPSLLYAQYFAVDGRPYGLLLGAYSLALLCWQSAVRSEFHRKPALVTLAVAVAFTLNTHFFAFLLVIPLYAAEVFRAVQRRKLDLPVLAALGAGTAAMVFILPFIHGAAEFRDHYIALNVDAHSIPLVYQSLLVFPDGAGGAGRAAFLAVLVLSLVWAYTRLFTHPAPGMLKAETVLLLALTALPFFGYIVAKYVAHSIYARYVLGTTIGLVLVMAISIAPLLRRRWFACAVFGVMLLIVPGHGVQRIRSERLEKQRRIAALTFSPAIRSALMNTPDQLVYIQDLETYFIARFYEPDPFIRSRLTVVISHDDEMKFMHQDTYWLQSTHLSRFTDSRTVTYEYLSAQPGKHLFVNMHNSVQWLDDALAESHAQVVNLGPAFGSKEPDYAGEFDLVSFPQAAAVQK